MAKKHKHVKHTHQKRQKHRHAVASKQETHQPTPNERMGIPQYTEPEPYARLGRAPELHQPGGVWAIMVRTRVPHIDPISYFRTSGDALTKAQRLEADLWQAAAAARKLVNLLKKAKGNNKYLETEWVRGIDGNGDVICKIKNPRPNPRLLMMQKMKGGH